MEQSISGLSMEVSAPPKPTIRLIMGESTSDIVIEFCIKKTLLNRLKYWLFSQFFPFKVEWL